MNRLPAPVAALGFLAAAVLATTGTLTLATSASAVIVPDTDGVLSVDANTYPLFEDDVQPGETRYWSLTTMLDSDENGTLSLQLESDGVLASDPRALQLRFERCTAPWVLSATPTCAGTRSVIVNQPLSQIDETLDRDLGTINPGTGPYFLAALSLPTQTPSEFMNQEGTIGFGFTAQESTAIIVIPGDGDDPSVTEGGGLARTGIDPLGPALLAAGLLLGGFILARQRTGRREELA
jgi:hypothetical protein